MPTVSAERPMQVATAAPHTRSHTTITERIIGLVVITVVAVIGTVRILSDPDHAADLATAWSWPRLALTQLTVAGVAVLLLATIAHHLAAAGAARAASGATFPRAELLGAQFAASAADRVAPAGLGAGAVNIRYFTRRGHLSLAEATGAVSALALVGIPTDIVTFAVLVVGGYLIGVPGAGTEIPTLASRLTHLLPSASWIDLVPAVAFGAALVILLARPKLRARMTLGIRANATGYARAFTGLATQPGRLGKLLITSALTTVILAAGFALSATLIPHGLAISTIGSLMIGYMAASAASNAVPVPGGVGVTETTFTAVLVANGMALGPAVATVLTFRIVTFWLPAVIGMITARALRRRGVL